MFIRRGVSDVSLDDVLKFSDVRKGAFYYYFESKDEFLRACFEECYLAPVLETLEEFKQREVSELSDIWYFFIHFTQRVQEKLDALLGENSVELNDVYANISYISMRDNFMGAHYSDFQERQYAYVEDCLNKLRENGLVAQDKDCAGLARMMCCCREGAIMMRMRDETMDFEGMMNSYFPYFERLLIS